MHSPTLPRCQRAVCIDNTYGILNVIFLAIFQSCLCVGVGLTKEKEKIERGGSAEREGKTEEYVEEKQPGAIQAAREKRL